MRPKLFRDPVHDIIAYDQDDPVEATLLALVDAPEVQRLRRVRQLGMTFLVFHGAEHSRFTHSMGVCHLARRMHDQLWPHGDPGQRLAVAAAALLHDVGHGPLSHVIERVTGIHHERTTAVVLLDPDRDVHRILAAADPHLPARLVGLLSKGGGPAGDLVSSQLDADRLDYILRDALCTGVKIGAFDLARILGMLQVVDERVAVNERAIEAVEGYLIARFHMYKQVYLHKASRSAEKMLEAAFARAHLVAPALDGPLGRLASGRDLQPEDIVALDDDDVWGLLKRWRDDADPILAELSAGLLGRGLFKTVELPPDDPRGHAAVIAEAREEAARAGADPEWHVLVDHGKDHPYTPYQAGLKAQPIHIHTRSGHLQPIEARSELVALLGRSSHEVVRLCVPARFKAVVERVVAGTALLV